MITENMRKSFDQAASSAVANAQAMIRANPEMLPTEAYKLAFAFTMELWVTSFIMQLEFLARTNGDQQ